jgi:hypothetical protein
VYGTASGEEDSQDETSWSVSAVMAFHATFQMTFSHRRGWMSVNVVRCVPPEVRRDVNVCRRDSSSDASFSEQLGKRPSSVCSELV